ncbi:hypothetical protein [Shewanella violacea]|uniref:Uncharacterized protein n=1 Tax=Shewanella violacea (strain JCM 10179 / CIP 106290 / LMG 19151 / DSS12) TaxID=637905 RepID=D4ZKH0_SHEVD|nr:hypothetical protein [Shewanella violacea]BAJ02169.1 hypothetical protein SVI_2198 [Shewanella violacea DSS12]
MKYKTIPNTNIQIPIYSPFPEVTVVDLCKLAHNAKVIKKLKAHWFGGAK